MHMLSMVADTFGVCFPGGACIKTLTPPSSPPESIDAPFPWLQEGDEFKIVPTLLDCLQALQMLCTRSHPTKRDPGVYEKYRVQGFGSPKIGGYLLGGHN